MANHKELLKWLNERIDIIFHCIREDEDKGIASPIMRAYYEKDMKKYNALVELVQEDYERQGAEPNLKPCPFCGADARLSINVSGNMAWYEIGCDECDACIEGSYTTKAEAIDAWNRRV